MLSHFIDEKSYKETFEANLNKGEWKFREAVALSRHENYFRILYCILSIGDFVCSWMIPTLLISAFLDEQAKSFWANQLPILIEKFADQASVSGDVQEEHVESRISSYIAEYQEQVNVLMTK